MRESRSLHKVSLLLFNLLETFLRVGVILVVALRAFAVQGRGHWHLPEF